MSTRLPTYGAEVEKPVANLETGESHKTSPAFFQRLQKEAEKRGTFDHLHKSDLKPEVTLGVISKDIGEQGLDNGFNLLETSTAVMPCLNDLADLLTKDLLTVQQSLEAEGASIINMSNHPLAKTDLESYEKFVAPKGLYPSLWYRGLEHSAGINANAQNSPSTGIEAAMAANAASIIIGVGAAIVGIFGNSPFFEGRRSSYKEVRLTMWDRMMKRSRFEGDRVTSRFPEAKFETLAQYFKWIFGGQTTLYFVLSNAVSGKAEYKNLGQQVVLIQGNPSVLEFLSKPRWTGIFFHELMTAFPPKPIAVTPNSAHMTTMQFANFSGARIRFALKENFPLREFVEACKKPHAKQLETIFAKFAHFLYIEGRDPGANFPDRELWQAGEEIARSVMIAPSAVQAGLIRNLSESKRLIAKYPWKKLGELRLAAIKNGLQGAVKGLTVANFAREVIEVAARGLRSDEQWMLAYPLWVLKTGKNGADRAIEFVENSKTNGIKALTDLIQSRHVVVKNL